MCECFKPAYSDYDFGYGLGVMGHLMHEYDHVGYHIFSDADISDADSCLSIMGPLRQRVKAEISRAAEQPLEEIPEFEVTSKLSENFQKGYVAGLNEMHKGLTHLSLLMINYPGETLDSLIIHDWAENWQETNRNFYFLKAPVFAEASLSDGDEMRILSSSMAWIVHDGDPEIKAWLEIEVQGQSTAEALVSALWSSRENWGKGIALSLDHKYSGPQDLDPGQTREFYFSNLCDDHWGEIAAYNSKLLREAGLTPEGD